MCFSTLLGCHGVWLLFFSMGNARIERMFKSVDSRASSLGESLLFRFGSFLFHDPVVVVVVLVVLGQAILTQTIHQVTSCYDVTPKEPC